MLRSVIQGLSSLRLYNSVPTQCLAAKEAIYAKNVAAISLPGPLLHHVRTTFVLRRKKRIDLAKAHKKIRSRRLKARHFLYELVEDTNLRKVEPIKVILKTGIDGLGSRGQVVEVSPHRARSQLLLPGLAVYASPENLEKYSSLQEDVSLQDQPSSPFARSTANILSSRVISVCMNKDNKWELEPWHVRVAFRKAGIIVPEDALTLPPHSVTGPDLSLQGKEFIVKVKINNKEETAVRCRIHHYASSPRDRLPWIDHHWQYPAEPLFPEDAPLLAELTKSNPYTRYPAHHEA